MKSMIPISIGSAIALVLSAASAHASVIVNYAMTANGAAINSALNVNPTTTLANVTATQLKNQAGVATTGSFIYNGNTDRVSSWAITVGSTNTTFADAVTVGNYITFNITPAEGFEIDLTNITFQAASGSSSTTSNRAFYLVTESLPGNFTSSSTVLRTDRTPGGGGTIPVQVGASAVDTIPKDYSVDLSSMASVTATQYFRFYLQGAIGNAITFDDIVINGTVSAVPEPTSALLGGVGVLLLLRRRREA